MFTAGIGENSAAIRERICRASAWLGIDIDPDANGRKGLRISRSGSCVSAWVVPTNEELMIARHTAVLLGLGPTPARKEFDVMAVTATQQTTRRVILGWIHWSALATGDQRPGLHPVELHAVRRGRELPGARHARTQAIWDRLKALFVEERKKGVLDISQVPSSITAHDAGYIDRENEISSGSRPRRR